jgi:hypothetical protein
MAEWLFEAGIGENRAILVENGDIVEAAIELPGLRAGTVVEARLTTILIPHKRGIVTLPGGEEALVEPLPRGVTEGARLKVEIVREAVPEAGREKLAKGRATVLPAGAGATLHERIGRPHPLAAAGSDRFEEAGWSELLDEARSGEILFPGGSLRMSLTPAMTLFDVDGSLDAPALAVAGAAAAARAIRRFGIGGSIGIDLPTLASKADRLAAANAFDATLPQPFERTAVNGFGFLQVVRRRERPSIPELLRSDPAGAAARALLRQAGRRTGPVTIVAAPAVVARLQREQGWIEALARQVGGPVALSAEAQRPIFEGHVHSRPS